MRRVLVTGSNGFLGQAVVPTLQRAGHAVIASVRRNVAQADGAEAVHVTDIGPNSDWTGALHGVHTVVHLGARVHVMRDPARDPEAAFHRVNAAGTRRLAEAAVTAGVQRFVLLSTVKVGGDETAPGQRLHESQIPSPNDAYGRSKAEAERFLAEIGERHGMRWIAMRPPLVYGPGVRGNFLSLLRLCDAGLPLPFASIDNARSVVGRQNLADAIRVAVEAPDIENGAYYVADDEDISTPELVRRLRVALGRRPLLVPFSPALLRLAAGVVGRRTVAERLLGSLRVDSSRFRQATDWTPPISMIKGLQETVDWYNRSIRRPD